MSFILNALRKSESERQRLSGATMAEFPLGRRANRQPWWVYALGVLLLLNLAVLALVLLRKPSDQQTPVTIDRTPSHSALPTQSAPPPVAQMAAPAPSTNLRDAAAPPQVIYESVPSEEREVVAAAAAVPDGPTLVRPSDGSAAAPLAAQLPATGELKLDLHVYSQNPSERFVLISMRRYTEGQQLPNGATVEQITPTGVVLYLNGQRYQLAR